MMSDETKHTPEPWQTVTGAARIYDDNGMAIANTTEANAARIVECVNAHDTLRATVAELMEALNQHTAHSDSAWGKVRPLLAKAREVLGGVHIRHDLDVELLDGAMGVCSQCGAIDMKDAITASGCGGCKDTHNA